MPRLWRKEKSIIYALHPEKIPADGARLTYTFGLGAIAFLATLITLLTGIALTFYYVPTPAQAHDSIVLITDLVSFGALTRGLHYWAAQLMVVAVTLHLARIIFTGGYRPPREFNWLIGIALLVVTLIWDFTGYVLRWDDGAYWAFLVGTNLFREIPVGGEAIYRTLVGDVQIGASALLRFYGWHILGLTAVGILGIVYHLWRLRKDGGVSLPVSHEGEVRIFISRDELFFREFILSALVSALLVLFTLVFPVPLGPPANLTAGLGDVQAPWIFLWVQNLLRSVPPLWAGVVVPACVLALIAVLPFLDRRGAGRAIWFARERWKPQIILAAIAIVLTALSLQELWR
jgi:quinol-cytochrome oxidoreductase complex cytochrome b subunit